MFRTLDLDFLNLSPRATPALRLSAPPTPPPRRHLKPINTSTVGPPQMATRHGICGVLATSHANSCAKDCRHQDQLCVPTHKVPQVAHTGPAVIVLHASGTCTVTTRLMGSLLTTRVGCGADPFSLQGSILCAGSSSLSLRFTLVRVFFSSIE